VTSRPLPAGDLGRERMLAVRPEAILLEAPSQGRNSLAATVEEISFLGAVVRIRARVNSAVVSMDIFNDPNRVLPERGAPVALGFSHDNLLVLDENAPA
jgi:putative spermidine/putrescine transport system ATP-binding protein